MAIPAPPAKRMSVLGLYGVHFCLIRLFCSIIIYYPLYYVLSTSTTRRKIRKAEVKGLGRNAAGRKVGRKI